MQFRDINKEREMRKVTHVLAALGVAAATMMAGSGSVQAEERQCRGTIGAVTVDNIRVPDGATCTLNGTRAQGTVYIGTGATLRANGVRVNGHIQAEGARSVFVSAGSVVGGNIQVKQGQSATINGATINGDLLFDENRGALSASNNVVGSNFQAFKNTGSLVITNNRIAQNLQCKENNPAPTGGDKHGRQQGRPVRGLVIAS